MSKADLILRAEVSSFVVQLLQRIQVLTDDGCMQVCCKLPLPLQK